MFFSVRPAKGWPLTVGTDRSTTQCLSEAREPGDVACEADDGSMICTELCPLIATEFDVEKEGLWIAAVCGFSELFSPSSAEPLAAHTLSLELDGGLAARFGVAAIDESTEEGSER